MTNLSAVSTLTAFGIIGVYGFFTIYRSIIRGRGSIKDSERIHRFLITSAGIFIGIGLTGLDGEGNMFEGPGFILGLMIAIVGLFLISLAKYYLQSNFYQPLEQISEYSAEFGTSFVGTRLPEVGVIELKSFAARFNKNALILAQRISKSEIQLEKLRKGVSLSIDNFHNLSRDVVNLGAVSSKSSNLAGVYSDNINLLQVISQEFIEWYSDTIENFRTLLGDLRALTNSGNLLAVNAAIESINMEVENPGITTIADKLHDLAKNLEDKYDSLQKTLGFMDEKYDDFNLSVSGLIAESDTILDQSSSMSSEMEQILENLQNYDRAIQREVDGIRTNLADVIAGLPDAF